MCINYQLYYKESDKTYYVVLLSYDVLLFCLIMISFLDSLSSLDCTEGMLKWWPMIHS
jgi:hypothetical protein